MSPADVVATRDEAGSLKPKKAQIGMQGEIPNSRTPGAVNPLTGCQATGEPSPSPNPRESPDERQRRAIAMEKLLCETGQFATVIEDRTPDLETGGQSLPRAWIVPAGWKETDDADPMTPVRTVKFQIGLTIDSTSHAEPEEVLDRLCCVVQNAIGGQSFGFCMPDETLVSEGLYPSNETYPRLTLVAKGQFRYLLSGETGRSTTPEI